MTNYPACIISVNNKSVSFGFPNEFSRIFLFQSKEKDYLAVKITQDLTKAMGPNNGLIYKISSIEDFQYLKSGLKVILECKVPKIIVEAPVAPAPLPPPQEEDSKDEEDIPEDTSIVEKFKNLLGRKK